jgi:hypothetical protein
MTVLNQLTATAADLETALRDGLHHQPAVSIYLLTPYQRIPWKSQKRHFDTTGGPSS